MMQCQICGNTNGPFEIFDFKNRVVLGCEDCAKLSKENKIRKENKKNDTTNIRNKRHVNRISRSNGRSK